MHLHGPLRPDDRYLSFPLKVFHHLQLLIICLDAMAERYSQARVVTIDEHGLLAVVSRLAITIVAGSNHDVVLVTSGLRTPYGYGVHYASVEHRLTVNHRDLAHVWQ